VRRLHFPQLSLDRLLKTCKTAIVQAFAVYKDRRRPAHAGLSSIIDIARDQIMDTNNHELIQYSIPVYSVGVYINLTIEQRNLYLSL